MLTQREQVPVRTYVRSGLVTSVFGVAALWFIRGLLLEGLYVLASAVGAVTIFLLMVYLRRRFSTLRWMAIGIALASLFAVYPILFNVYVGFTNMGAGHLHTKEQAIDRLEAEQYLAEDAPTFSWRSYRSGDDYALLLWSDDASPNLVTVGDAPQPVDVPNPDESPPDTLDGYTLMSPRDVVPIIDALAAIEFGDETTVRIQSLREAAATVPRYEYDSATDTMIDLAAGTHYVAVNGAFTSADGDTLIPGFITLVGTDNFQTFLTDNALRNPLFRALVWNLVFAFASVLLAFGLGLVVATLFDDLPGRSIIRALLIIPYPIPVLVSVLIWRSMLNPDFGMIGQLLGDIFGQSPQFFLDPNWARFALIFINIWLSYPYFYVVTSGAMRSIPESMLDAAEVDGASHWQGFRFITFPQLIVIVMPLLIASFSFNFNNFNLIYIFNNGNPPMGDTIIPIGHTDILISFIYKLAFVSSSTSDYGLGAAISVLLFVVVGSITWFQIRSTKALEST